MQSAALAQLEQAEADAGRIAAAESMAPIEEASVCNEQFNMLMISTSIGACMWEGHELVF